MSTGRTMSLRARVLAGVALVAIVLVAVATIITLTTRAQLIEQVDERLQSFPAGRSESPGPDAHGPGDSHEPRELDEPQRLSDVYEGFVTADGTLVTLYAPTIGDASAPAIDAADLPAFGSRSSTLFTAASDTGGRTYRVIARPLASGVAVTALPLDDVESTISRLVVVEVVGSLIILAALGVVAWWVVHLGIRPVQRMTETAARIADGDLDVRIPESAAGTESGQLAVALNRMLGTIGAALDERAASEDRLRRFVADASHELRTPVTTIRGYAELYRHGGLDERDALDDAMRRTEQEAVRMGRLVDDMLLLAKLDQERPLEERAVDVGRLVRDAGADARAASPERTIDVDTEPGLVVNGDEDRLRQVLANIVGNALVHTGPEVEIALRATRTRDDVTVEVQDRGPGMRAEVAERVTERFFRADPARSRHRGGSGLGLSIVEATVRAHGGSVTIDSTPGVGTTVRFTIPTSGAVGREPVPDPGPSLEGEPPTPDAVEHRHG